MAEIVAGVRPALQPLVEAGVVLGVRMVGLEVGTEGSLKPIVSISIGGDRPEAHGAEISRLIHSAGLDVEWTLSIVEPTVRTPVVERHAWRVLSSSGLEMTEDGTPAATQTGSGARRRTPVRSRVYPVWGGPCPGSRSNSETKP